MGRKLMHSCVFLLGATGVGKSEVALALARKHGAAILSLDAMQVYRGADIGVGKPTLAEREEIPHGGLDLVEFGAAFDVARYVAQAIAFLREQVAGGRGFISGR
jgi:tRNA dimethylallyltransferase